MAKLNFVEIREKEEKFIEQYGSTIWEYKGTEYEIEDIRLLAGNDGEPKWFINYFYFGSDNYAYGFVREESDFFNKFTRR